MGVVRRRTVSETDVAPGEVARYDRHVERRWAFDASDVIALLAGLLFVVIGLIALVELGFDDFPSEATTTVMGLVHTQLVAIVSIVLGLFLLGGAGSVGRGGSIFAGALALVVGIVVVAANEDLDATIRTDSDYGWLALIVGLVVLVAAIAIPSIATRQDRVVDDDYR